MTILLHNLLARAPRLNDADAVSKLLIACDIVFDGVSHYTKEDVLVEWQKSGFNLATDARVVATTDGKVVGYASTTAHSEHVSIDMTLGVHPDYRGRGIGTLLLRMTEARAREYVKQARPDTRVMLNCAVNNANQVASNLLEHEGYTLVRHFWRTFVVMEKELPLVFDMTFPCVTGTTRIFEPSGRYVVRQYDVYEKALREGKTFVTDANLSECLATA